MVFSFFYFCVLVTSVFFIYNLIKKLFKFDILFKLTLYKTLALLKISLGVDLILELIKQNLILLG